MCQARAYQLAKQYNSMVTERRDIHSLHGLPVMSGVRPKPCMASLVSEMLAIFRLNKPEKWNLNRIFALVLRKEAENTHHDPI